MTHARAWALALMVFVSGCATEENKPSAWEIVQGTSALTLSRSLHPTTGAILADFPTRTGQLVVADDSTVTGWIKMAAGDTVHIVAGTVAFDSVLVMVLPGLSPVEYEILTSGDFPDTYGLRSTATVSGGDVSAPHKVYWQFER